MSAVSTSQLQATYAPSLQTNWTRRAFHASIQVGDWIFLHMGEIGVGQHPFDNNLTDFSHNEYAVNATLSLNIANGWSDPHNVQFQAFSQPDSAVYRNHVLWYDSKENLVYSFGGEESASDGSDAPYVDLSTWKLIPTSDGQGTWSKNSSATDPPFSKPGLTRPFGGASAQSNTTAFYLGGISSNQSSPDTKDLKVEIPTPGLVTYEFATGAWANVTLDPTLPLGIPNGSYEWGGMEYIPTLGPNGMLVIWGGDTSNRTIYVPGAQGRPMNNIVLHDLVSSKWYTQQVTGSTPTSRSRFCSVSVSDSRPVGNVSGTHEIFMYGGWGGITGSSAEQYDEIWVLSLPAFTWQQLDASHRNARIGHTCHLVGNRQLLSIGGADATKNDYLGDPDFYNWNGLGVFDLTAATWLNGLPGNPQSYQRPPAIQDFYDSNGPYPKTWTQPALKSLLINNVDNTPQDAPISNPSGQNSSQHVTTSASSSGHQAGVIAGAAIGAALASLMLLLLFFYCLRRRYRYPNAIPAEMPGDFTQRKELVGSTPSHGKHGLRGLFSRGISRRPSRGRSRVRPACELPAGEAVNEIGQPTPLATQPHPAFRGLKGEMADYFNYFRPGIRKSMVQDDTTNNNLDEKRQAQVVHLVTPGVKEAPVSITPRRPTPSPPPPTPPPHDYPSPPHSKYSKRVSSAPSYQSPKPPFSPISIQQQYHQMQQNYHRRQSEQPQRWLLSQNQGTGAHNRPFSPDIVSELSGSPSSTNLDHNHSGIPLTSSSEGDENPSPDHGVEREARGVSPLSKARR